MDDDGIDRSLYPDVAQPPYGFSTPAEKADYVQRVCGAWDIGIVPYQSTFELLSTWREIFDAFPLPHSSAYHAFRERYGWPPVPAEGIRSGSASASDAPR
jgi:hypothetical protein